MRHELEDSCRGDPKTSNTNIMLQKDYYMNIASARSCSGASTRHESQDGSFELRGRLNAVESKVPISFGSPDDGFTSRRLVGKVGS
jgi:hypothetical protein